VYGSKTYAAGEWAMSAVWMLAVFMLLVQSSALITGERARQTLDVLMSTPMMTRDIVMQKMAGVHYLINILYVPMGTAAIFWLFWLSAGQHRIDSGDALWQVVRLIVQPLIYLPLIAWGGFYCGLKCKSQTQAMLLGCVILAVLVGLPRVLLPMLTASAQYTLTDLGFNYARNAQRFREVNFFVYPVQILFPCSNYLDVLLTSSDPNPYSARPAIPAVNRVFELLHWCLYGLVIVMLRLRAPSALTHATQRAEAPFEEMALEPA
jgi:hypothetical protein